MKYEYYVVFSAYRKAELMYKNYAILEFDHQIVRWDIRVMTNYLKKTFSHAIEDHWIVIVENFILLCAKGEDHAIQERNTTTMVQRESQEIRQQDGESLEQSIKRQKAA